MKAKPAIAVVLTLIVFLQAISPVLALTWSAPSMVSNNGYYTGRPELVQRANGTIVLVYSSTRGTTVDLFTKLYAPSTGWSQEYRLTNGGFQHVSPSIAELRNGTLILVWATNPGGTEQDIHMARTDGTRIWAETTVVGGSTDDGLPSVAVTRSSDIWVFWARFNSVGNIYYNVLRGGSWLGEQLLTTEGGHNLSPSAYVTKDDTVWVTWSKQNSGNDFEIYAKYNRLGAWSSNIRITSSSANDGTPDLTQDRDGSIWVFWAREVQITGQTFQDELYSTYSSDNGATWPSANTVRMTNDPSGFEKDDREPAAVQAFDKKLWLAYMSDPDDAFGNNIFQIYLLTSSMIAAQDIGVRSITANPSVAGTGATVTVTVDVRNMGDSQQTTTLNLYLKGASETLIGTRTVTILAGQSSPQAFTLSTSGLALGQYTFRATVTPATGETAANQGDNNVTDGSLLIVSSLPWDVDHDGDVDLDDLILVYIHMFTGDLRYDVDHDGDVDLDDLIAVYTHMFI